MRIRTLVLVLIKTLASYLSYFRILTPFSKNLLATYFTALIFIFICFISYNVISYLIICALTEFSFNFNNVDTIASTNVKSNILSRSVLDKNVVNLAKNNKKIIDDSIIIAPYTRGIERITCFLDNTVSISEDEVLGIITHVTTDTNVDYNKHAAVNKDNQIIINTNLSTHPVYPSNTFFPQNTESSELHTTVTTFVADPKDPNLDLVANPLTKLEKFYAMYDISEEEPRQAFRPPVVKLEPNQELVYTEVTLSTDKQYTKEYSSLSDYIMNDPVLDAIYEEFIKKTPEEIKRREKIINSCYTKNEVYIEKEETN